MSNPQFSTKAFLENDNPWNYLTEVFHQENAWQIPQAELTELLNAIPQMDEIHTAFAMPVAEHSNPSYFGELAATLLCHSSMSVRINAYRVLRAIPAAKITPKTRDLVAAALDSCPEREHCLNALSRP